MKRSHAPSRASGDVDVMERDGDGGKRLRGVSDSSKCKRAASEQVASGSGVVLRTSGTLGNGTTAKGRENDDSVGFRSILSDISVNAASTKDGMSAKEVKVQGEGRDAGKKVDDSTSVSDFDSEKDDRRSKHELYIKALLKRQFRSPVPGYDGSSPSRNRALGYRHSSILVPLFDPNAEGALVLYEPQQLSATESLKMDQSKKEVHVVVDPSITVKLRPHQRAGVSFIYKCVTGARHSTQFGCIVADEMGLGKTLQCITAMWTLLTQGPSGTPSINKAMIVCPSALIVNWKKEIRKFIPREVSVLAIGSDEKGDSRGPVKQKLESYIAQQGTRVGTPILILSYEMLRTHSEAFRQGEIGLMVCDEAHRLKNMDSQLYKALSDVKCKRRVLLSATPVQNDLLEYYSLANFANPGMLGDAATFKKVYEKAIMEGRDAGATEKMKKLGDEKMAEMLDIASQCSIRRTSDTITHFLPVKYELVVCCKLTEEQEMIYKEIVKNAVGEIGRSKGTALSLITTLQKLCNHPLIAIEDCKKNYPESAGLFPKDMEKKFVPSCSSKMCVLDCLLAATKEMGNDKFVVVSNFTKTISALAKLCELRRYKYVTLDGTCSNRQRESALKEFHDSTKGVYVLLLSSKAGGVGLNIIGANRLVMFDSDWNPANDVQAMARIWRDGQQKNCFIYRLISTGTIEEEIFKRQIYKRDLSSCVVDGAKDVTHHFSKEDLRGLFKYKNDTTSAAHDSLNCARCVNGIESREPSATANTSSHLSDWHHRQSTTIRKVPDMILKRIFQHCDISFVFYQKSHDSVAHSNVESLMSTSKKAKECEGEKSTGGYDKESNKEGSEEDIQIEEEVDDEGVLKGFFD